MKPTTETSRATDTKTRILDAAAALHAEGALQMTEVARRAMISRSEVYRRFPNKQALLTALVETGRLSPGEGHNQPSRERILDALASLLAAGGISHATIDEIAAKAHVGQVTVYRLFGDRDGLLKAFINERTPRKLFHQHQPTATAPHKRDPGTYLHHLAETILRFFSEHPHFLRMTMAPEPELMALMERSQGDQSSIRRALQAYFQSLCDDGLIAGSPALLSSSFFGMLLGLSYSHPNATLEACKEMAAFATHTLLHGAMPTDADRPENTSSPSSL